MSEDASQICAGEPTHFPKPTKHRGLVALIAHHPIATTFLLWLAGMALAVGIGWVTRTRSASPRASTALSVSTAPQGSIFAGVVIEWTSHLSDVYAFLGAKETELKFVGAQPSERFCIHEHEAGQVTWPVPWLRRAGKEAFVANAQGAAKFRPVDVAASTTTTFDRPSMSIEIVRPGLGGEMVAWSISLRPAAWLVLGVAILAALPVVVITTTARIRAARRLRENSCASCGHSLAGLTRERPCPECGERRRR